MIRTSILLIAAIFATLALSLAQGDYPIPVSELAGALTGAGGDLQAAAVVQEIRLPRALLALTVGLALACAGAITQAVLRNPLAEPGLLGINAGAALAVMVLVVWQGSTSVYLLPLFSFAGALVMASIIYALSWKGGASSLRIILVGIGLSAFCGALSTLISVFGDITAVQRAMIWLSGSVYDSPWSKVAVLSVWLVIPLCAVWFAGRELDLVRFDEDVSASLGQRTHLMRGLLILATALISGAAVAAAGLIGFVGLVAPHLARAIVGHTHYKMLPVACLVGGLLVMAADLIGRTVIAPAQLPAGIVTAILGAPCFFYLMWRRGNG